MPSPVKHVWPDESIWEVLNKTVLPVDIRCDQGPPLPARDEEQFLAGGLANPEVVKYWEQVLLPASGLPYEVPFKESIAGGGSRLDQLTVLSWVRDGVNVEHFFRHFEGETEKGLVSSDEPVRFRKPNASIPEKHLREFVSGEVGKWERSGAVVEAAEVPGGLHLIHPLLVEPEKPIQLQDPLRVLFAAQLII